jgi:hypothetical protein
MNASSDLAERAARAEARADREQAPSWNPRKQPEQPKQVTGLVVERRTRVGMGFQGRDVDTVEIETTDGSGWLVWLFGTILQNDMAGVLPGDVVSIRYMGHRESRTPNG